MVMFLADVSSAEDASPEVTEIDPITIDGEEKTAFEYLGIVYVVTNDAEAEETVGVYGVSTESAVDGFFVCVNNVVVGEDDDEVSYSVTSVLTQFNESTGVAGKLILSMSIETYEKDCFKDLGLSGLVVSDAVDDEMMADAGLSPGDYTIFSDSVAADYTLSVNAGDVNGNVIANYNGGENLSDMDFYSTITMTVECPFENPGYDCDGFTDSADNEIALDAQAFVIGGKLYLDGEEYSGTTDVTAQWSLNQDYLAEYEIEIRVPFLTLCTITGTYEVWMMWATVGIIVVLAILGIAMFSYRTITARKS